MFKRGAFFLLLSLSACWAQPGDPNTISVPGNPNVPVDPMMPQVGRFHPEGWYDPANHGPAAKLNQLDCRTCHGQDLAGGAALSCDSCHRAGWRTNCTFCHGGTENMTGAPPRDFLGETNPLLISFRAHTQHVSERNHAPFDCSECHKKPTDVLSPGHLFDDTKGVAEVDFSGGRSHEGVYEGQGACSNLYCHSDGRGNLGAYTHELERPSCTTCHDARRTGAHGEHIGEDGITCQDCHGTVVGAAMQIINPALHVNRELNLALPSTMSRSNATCTGSCHGERHQSREWRADDDG